MHYHNDNIIYVSPHVRARVCACVVHIRFLMFIIIQSRVTKLTHIQYTYYIIGVPTCDYDIDVYL